MRPGLLIPTIAFRCSGLLIRATQHSGVTNTRIRIREDFPGAPLCPHCGKEIQELAVRRVESALGVRFVYYCTDCRKVLGVSHRTGFWMG